MPRGAAWPPTPPCRTTSLAPIAEGWRRTIAPELLAPTVAEYFELLQSTWASRSFTMASLVVSRLFPAPLVDEELAAMARAWLDANPSPRRCTGSSPSSSTSSSARSPRVRAMPACSRARLSRLSHHVPR